MARVLLSGKEIRDLCGEPSPRLPKYAPSLLNLANQIAQATRPKWVGRMHEIFDQANPETLDEWRNWYLEHYGDGLEEAISRIEKQLHQFKEAIDKIGTRKIRDWLIDLVIVKTWMGLRI